VDLIESKSKKSEQRHPWELARYEVMRSLLKKTFKGQMPKQIWDVGCGDTYFVERLAGELPQSQLKAIDIAFTPELLAHYRAEMSQPNVEIFKAVDDIQGVQQVDLIYLMDVIEHIEDDLGFLQWLQSFPAINEKTYFFITVPAFQSLFCSHDRYLLHYRRYDNQSLRETVEKVGLEVHDIGYFFSSLLLPRQLQVWKENKQAQKGELEDTTGLVEWSAGNFKTQLIKNVLLADYRFGQFFKSMGLKLPGLSNYVICSPKAASL